MGEREQGVGASLPGSPRKLLVLRLRLRALPFPQAPPPCPPLPRTVELLSYMYILRVPMYLWYSIHSRRSVPCWFLMIAQIAK